MQKLDWQYKLDGNKFSPQQIDAAFKYTQKSRKLAV